MIKVTENTMLSTPMGIEHYKAGQVVEGYDANLLVRLGKAVRVMEKSPIHPDAPEWYRAAYHRMNSIKVTEEFERQWAESMKRVAEPDYDAEVKRLAKEFKDHDESK